MYIGIASTKIPIRDAYHIGLRPIRTDSEPPHGSRSDVGWTPRVQASWLRRLGR